MEDTCPGVGEAEPCVHIKQGARPEWREKAMSGVDLDWCHLLWVRVASGESTTGSPKRFFFFSLSFLFLLVKNENIS